MANEMTIKFWYNDGEVIKNAETSSCKNQT
jgi:hypothetical protein